MSIALSGSLMVFFLVTWWRVTWYGTPKSTLMILVLLALAAAILTLILEIARLTAAAS